MHRSTDENPLIRPLPARREIHLGEVVLLIRRRIWLILRWALAGVGFAVLLLLISHKQYSSTATIQVHNDSESSLSLGDLGGVASQVIGGDALSVDLLTQQVILQNENVALKVMQDLKLADHLPFSGLRASTAGAENPFDDPAFRDKAVGLFQSRLRVTLVKGTRLIDVTYTDEDPKLAAQIANAVVDAYLVEVTQQRYDATSKTSEWLANQISGLKEKVGESQKQVNEFRQKAGLLGVSPVISAESGSISGGGLDPVEMSRLTDLDKQLTQAEIARISNEAIDRLAGSMDSDLLLGVEGNPSAGDSGGSLLSAAHLDLSMLHQLRARKGQLKQELAANVGRGAKNPITIGIQSQIEEVDKQIGQEMQRLNLQTKKQLELSAAAERAIRGEVEKEKARIAGLNNSADQLLLLQQEEASNRALYESLYGKLEAANVLAGAKSSNVTIVNPARVPSRPSKPKPAINIALGLFAGLALGLVSAFAGAYLNDVIMTPDDIQSGMNLGILGIVPRFNGKSKGKARVDKKIAEDAESASEDKNYATWVVSDSRSATAEAFRQIRTAILLSRPGHAPKSVLFSSSMSGDGKSTTCLNLGFAFAVQGSKVLVIDGDLRKPTIHKKLGLPNVSGLSQCLSSNIDPETVIQQNKDVPSLHVLTSGPVPPTPAELLGSKAFAEVLDHLKERYDFIFIDAPPLNLVTDAVLVAQVADGIVLVVRAGVTRRVYLRQALHFLSGTRRNMLGVVLNAVDVNSSQYGAYYGYYGDKSYYGDKDA